MIVVRAIYDGRQVKFLESIPVVTRPTNIIVKLLDYTPLHDANEVVGVEESIPLDLVYNLE